MKIKCIALDLDRTTLNTAGRLPPANKAAIELAISSGVHVVIASGRAFDTLPEEVLSIPGIKYAVTCNGAAMYDLPAKKCLKRYRLSGTAVEAVMRVTKEEDVTYEAFIDGIAYAGKEYIEDPVRFGATSQAVSYVRKTRRGQEDIAAFIHERKEQLDSMDIVVKEEEKKGNCGRRSRMLPKRFT